ncbi:hypothetical protein BGZ70_007439 [Mortierella alpina]|uniref:Ribosome-assembly protein 3 C-terminal domain-containing protein n=1 Tax=Mortierella alpina TaxID=64518 RepID=A0A9P6J845_MORAP|nr:hypothetical protein BGZ70_007439 [Mortierella alpina]
MGTKTKENSSKRASASNEPKNHVAPAQKRTKKSGSEIPSSIALSKPIFEDVDMEDQEDMTSVQDPPEGDDEDNDMEMQDDRESSDEGSDVEDDEDQELRTNNATTPKKEAHTSDRVQKIMTNPEIEAAFHDQYMTQITQAFGDELNTLRETDSLEDSHLELLIDSLRQTGHIYRVLEKELWVAGDQ